MNNATNQVDMVCSQCNHYSSAHNSCINLIKYLNLCKYNHPTPKSPKPAFVMEISNEQQEQVNEGEAFIVLEYIFCCFIV